jgi:hypothetical protein
VPEFEEPGAEIFNDASLVPSSRRGAILADLDRIAASYRKVSVPHWSEEHSPFTRDFGIALLLLQGTVVGYSAFKRLSMMGWSSTVQDQKYWPSFKVARFTRD